MIKNYIESLYLENFYKKDSFEGFLAFSLNDSKRINFSVLINSKPSKALEEQDEIFNICKERYKNPSFDKNCSLVILWEVEESMEYDEIKQEILKAEENPYMFRKYVLYYKKSELESLIQNLNGKSLNKYIQNNVNDSKVFKTYKRLLASSWQALMYRIVIKLPFFKVETEEGKTLDSLIEENNNKLISLNLKEFNDEVLKRIESIKLTTSKNKEESIKLYKLLEPILEEE